MAEEDVREPDYRMSLAAERTYLAYVRTGLALMAAGVAVAAGLPHVGALIFRRVLGVTLAITSAGVVLGARRRWVAIDRAMRRGEPLPTTSLLHFLSWLVAALAVAAAVVALF